MDGRFYHFCPKIQGLLDLRHRHPEAFDATLLERGFRFADVGSCLTWWDLHAIFSTAPYDSPIQRALNPKDWWWANPVNEIIVGLFESNQMLLAVAERRQGIKRSELPKPVPRPWDVSTNTEKIGDKPMPLHELRKAIGW